MKIDTHVLFLILLAGVVSIGLVGASIMSSDVTMKQEVFDGIKVSVPADSNFVKAGDGVYKDSKYGITINTFKDNSSMIDFLKNTKKSKVIPVKNQPPQSVAFKKGDTINILVTNGQEGVSVSSTDGELTAKIANNVIFSNNHKSVKPAVIPGFRPHLDLDDDFDLMFLLLANVDTKIFNQAILEQSIVKVASQENDNSISTDSSSSSNSSSSDSNVLSSDSDVSNINSSSDLNNVLTEGNNSDTSSDSTQATPADSSSSDDSSSAYTEETDSFTAQSAEPSSVASPSSSAPASSGSSSSSSSDSGSSNNAPQKLSLSECQKAIEDSIKGTGLTIKKHEESGNEYIFYLEDSQGNEKTIIIDPLTGDMREGPN